MPGGFLPTSPLETSNAPLASPLETERTPLQADEEALEQLHEQEKVEDFLEEDVTTSSASNPVVQAMATPVAAPVAAAAKDEALLQVEKILEDGLGDFVHAMPEAPRARFLQLGQQLAAQLAMMVRGYKVKVREVVRLIREWLLVIPGVNSFFLEQEAKIKTDRILQYEEHYHEAHPVT